MQEYPVDPVRFYSPIGSGMHRSIPFFTPTESLMQTGSTSEMSTIEMIALRELVNDAIDDILTELELWVFNALFVEQKSLRKLGNELSIPKTTVARIRDRSTEKLRKKLSSEPLIQEYLNR